MFLCVWHVYSAADVPASPLSESQNRLLSNNQHANSIGDHLADDTLKSGELLWRWQCFANRININIPLFALWRPVTLMPFALLHSWKRNRHSLHGERVVTRWKWIFHAFIRVNSSTNNCSAASDLCFVFVPFHRRNSSVIWYDALSNAAVQLVTWQQHSPAP